MPSKLPASNTRKPSSNAPAELCSVERMVDDWPSRAPNHCVRQHARLRLDNDTWLIEDLGSRNGTLVNGVPIQAGPIQLGDRIRIGDVEMVFEP